MSTLKLYNTLTRSKEVFTPIDPQNVRMYVCGPTVYDFAHIGNARPAIVFDVLYRLLRHLYGPDRVTYVRNITDVDDKINDRAARDFPGLPLNEAIRRVTETTATQYQSDTKALGCLEPNVQPRATDNIVQMIDVIKTLIAKGHAYAAEGEVLFEVATMADYGRLSRRVLDEQQAGARVAVEAHKRNPVDFVLWKLSSENEPGWESPWGRGRPGWHIECSAMSNRYLGETFDIHGGGLDLIFPHHENEIAQSRCAFGHDVMANVWMHNGFLQVEGEKMSKSLGNFVTINELLATGKFGGRSWPGEVLRLAMLKTHYRQPIDWTNESLLKAKAELHEMAITLMNSRAESQAYFRACRNELLKPTTQMVEALSDDLNTSQAITVLRSHLSKARQGDEDAKESLIQDAEFLGVLRHDKLWLFSETWVSSTSTTDRVAISDAISSLRVAIANDIPEQRDVALSKLATLGLKANYASDGYISLDAKSNVDSDTVSSLITARLAARAAKNWSESDRIRDELVAMGIQIMDAKDPVTGEMTTKWEVKR